MLLLAAVIETTAFACAVAIAVGFLIATASKVHRRAVTARSSASAEQVMADGASQTLEVPSILAERSRIVAVILQKLESLPALNNELKLAGLIRQAVLSVDISFNDEWQSVENGTMPGRQEMMDYVVKQSIKEIDCLNQEVSRLLGEVDDADKLRHENKQLRRDCHSLQNDLAELKKHLSQPINNSEEEIRNLEYQLLYGNTEKDKIIASLQAELAEKEAILNKRLQGKISEQEDSINKWLFDDCDQEFAL
uniref:Uncharacterized protein n=1 Tax=Spongospora subterranea TaxID=70186 RepID=A0A0H5RLI1_9EUKA|eukprot:CRZ09589.1 hypothetical protein [Spongospora subterranea]